MSLLQEHREVLVTLFENGLIDKQMYRDMRRTLNTMPGSQREGYLKNIIKNCGKAKGSVKNEIT